MKDFLKLILRQDLDHENRTKIPRGLTISPPICHTLKLKDEKNQISGQNRNLITVSNEYDWDIIKRWRRAKRPLETHKWKDNKRFEFISECRASREGVPTLDLETLCWKIKTNFFSIHELTLCLEDCSTISDKLFELLGVTIGRNLSNLKKLTVALSKCNQITDKALKSFGSVISPNLKRLEHLNLTFSNGSLITKCSLKALVYQIRRWMTQLKHLKLSLIQCRRVSNKELEILGSQFVLRFPSLKSLMLDFSWCGRQISDKGLKSLLSAIGSNLNQLRHLQLSLRESCLTCNSLKIVAHEICTNLVSLESLELNFSMCEYVEEDGFILLGSQIGNNFLNLKKLVLGFRYASRISDKALEAFASEINRKLDKLEEFKLNLDGCYHISYKGLEMLINKIKDHSGSAKKFQLTSDRFDKSYDFQAGLQQKLDVIPDFNLP